MSRPEHPAGIFKPIERFSVPDFVRPTPVEHVENDPAKMPPQGPDGLVVEVDPKNWTVGFVKTEGA